MSKDFAPLTNNYLFLSGVTGVGYLCVCVCVDGGGDTFSCQLVQSLKRCKLSLCCLSVIITARRNATKCNTEEHSAWPSGIGPPVQRNLSTQGGVCVCVRRGVAEWYNNDSCDTVH